MSTLEILTFILFIVVIVTSVSEKVNLPYPLLLVVAGLVVGFIPDIPNWHPSSEIVLALFLPPILFRAARLINWRDIKSNLGTIGSLSIVLVLLTAFLVAIVLTAFVPQMNFATALVLGAIISPTDTVAATAVLSKMNVRQHIIRTIEVESLFNDAVGIVLYQTALVFVALGSLSLVNVGIYTVFVGLGGIAVGLVFAYFTSLIVEQFLAHSENELPVIMSLILAYVAYLFAQRIGVSGVLAVVAAGLFHKKTERIIEPKTRLSEKTVWDTLIFFLNGIVFITIGIQFPSYLKKVSYLPAIEIITFSLITIVAILLLRVTWVTLSAYLPYLWPRFSKQKKTQPPVSFKKIIIVSWSGMRGLVSLALAIALPLYITPNEFFPYRDLIIFLTIIVILFTLLVQGLTLPSIIKRLGAGKDDRGELLKIEEIYQQLTKKAIQNIQALEAKTHLWPKAAVTLVENYYANRLLRFTVKYETRADIHEIGEQAENLLAKILQYERNELNKLRLSGDISEEIYIRIIHKLDRDQVGFASYK